MSTDLEDALSRLEQIQQSDALTQESQALVSAMRTLLTAVGQCEIEEPFAPLHPVLTSDGLRWCCEHPERHCSDIVG